MACGSQPCVCVRTGIVLAARSWLPVGVAALERCPIPRDATVWRPRPSSSYSGKAAR
jgi:hypothetical protein